jgi:hypothetical protein
MKFLDVPRSGSYAGVTSSRNRFGQYLRTRAIPVQPRTPKQTTIRSLFTAGSSDWRGLSDVQRTAWNDYAAQISYSDRLGSSYSPTGAALFVAACVQIGGTGFVADAPVELPTWSLSVFDMTYVDPTPGPEALTFSVSSTSTSNAVIVETSGPVSPGITSAAAVRRWRSLPNTALNLQPRQYSFTATPVAILTEYKILFPSPLTGNVIWFRFNEVFYDTGGLAPITNRLKQTFRFVVP